MPIRTKAYTHGRNLSLLDTFMGPNGTVVNSRPPNVAATLPGSGTWVSSTPGIIRNNRYSVNRPTVDAAVDSLDVAVPVTGIEGVIYLPSPGDLIVLLANYQGGFFASGQFVSVERPAVLSDPDENNVVVMVNDTVVCDIPSPPETWGQPIHIRFRKSVISGKYFLAARMKGGKLCEHLGTPVVNAGTHIGVFATNDAQLEFIKILL